MPTYDIFDNEYVKKRYLFQTHITSQNNFQPCVTNKSQTML